MANPFKNKYSVRETFSDIFKTETFRNAGHWASEKRKLPKGSAMAGKFDPSITPYTFEIYEDFENSLYEELVFCCATQQAKTEVIFNIAGKTLDCKPMPMIFVYPTEADAMDMSKDRFSKMIELCDTLRKKASQGKKNTNRQKFISSVAIYFMWATSASKLASRPAGLVFVDETDHMVKNVKQQGDPVTIIKARMATYKNSRIVITSSPTIEDASPIWNHFLEGTQKKWHIPCKHCETLFLPCLERFRYKAEEDVIKDAWLECPNCNGEMREEDKTYFNQNGRYVGIGQEVDGLEVKGKLIEKTKASFWVSGLCSPFRNFKTVATMFYNATKSGIIEKIQAVVNTILGECWRNKGDVPELQDIKSLVDDALPRNVLPASTLMLTCGADVGKHDIHYAIRAWGLCGESWTVDAGILYGDPRLQSIWKHFKKIILERSYVLGDRRYIINQVGIDSRYLSDCVYVFCKQYPNRCYPMKGYQDPGYYVQSKILSVDLIGRKIPEGVRVWNFNDGHFKSQVHSKVARQNKGNNENWHIYQEIDEEFLKQILGEQLLTLSTGRQIWDKVYSNHFLDCEKQNEALAFMLNLSSITEWKAETEDDGKLKVVKRGLIQ